MRGPHYARFLASTALSLMLAAPLGALAQDSHEPAATFNERFPADQTSTQPSLEIPEVKKEQNVVGTKRAVRAKRPRSRVVVVPRSFLASPDDNLRLPLRIAQSWQTAYGA
jgi:hypothetical protein